ncbi:hypothetical protein [Polyangium sp. y55x31]|uniref:hypothetical protein n=1 Tax=Polyangium sp. y55x31 TaxID=3042688 RepID=UPI0024826158|nr:hypothetical protein [Polyangium sp. y55x31]MDI1479012.1 hypothetical protein [Polyangium sp. y55x31]
MPADQTHHSTLGAPGRLAAPSAPIPEVLAELAGHPRGDDLARLVHAIAFACADERRTSLPDGARDAAARLGLSTEDAETPFGNVLAALERSPNEPTGPATRALLSALLARGIALAPPEGVEAERRVVEALAWVAAHTPLDALSAIDAALGSKADGLWREAAALVRRADEGAAPLVGRAGALVVAAALGASSSSAARDDARALAAEARDPVVRALLQDARSPGAAAAAGELVPAPRGPVALVLLAVTGLLFLMPLARLIGRFVLRYRCPAEMRVSPRSITVLAKTELLGRTVREREMVFPVEGLSRVAREVRYPRLAMYAGLFALAIGSYVGISLFVDGARAGSPDLLGMGALLVAVSIAIDFALTNLMPAARGRCRVVLVPQKGKAVALGRLDPALADSALGRLLQSSSS